MSRLLNSPWGAVWRHWSRQWIAAGRDVVFPPCCLVCGADQQAPRPALSSTTATEAPNSFGIRTPLQPAFPEVPICAGCRRELVPRRHGFCRRCGAATESAPGIFVEICHDCQGAEYRFERVFCLGRYDDLLRDCLLRIKRPGHEGLARALMALLAAEHAAELHAAAYDVAVPLPMHWWRRWRRGMNHAEILAAALADNLGIPCGNGLRRIRATKPQGELTETQRKRNLRRALRMNPGCDYRDARVLLVDDILTTGTTCNEAARVMLKAGAAVVAVAVLARTHLGQ